MPIHAGGGGGVVVTQVGRDGNERNPLAQQPAGADVAEIVAAQPRELAAAIGCRADLLALRAVLTTSATTLDDSRSKWP